VSILETCSDSGWRVVGVLWLEGARGVCCLLCGAQLLGITWYWCLQVTALIVACFFHLLDRAE
jgi:hypothetical protein